MRWTIFTFCVLAFLGLVGESVLAQTIGGSRYFPETGHWVSGDFLEKYDSASHPEEIYGNPITDSYEDELSGLMIQYFEKARFERHPAEVADLRIKLTNLGSFLYQPGDSFPEQPNSPACRLFTEGGESYQVCYAFLDYFEANGGIAQFGYPISNFEAHDGWIVQYFQKTRFEWHPEFPAGKRVVLTNLGSRYFADQDENPVLLRPNRADAIPIQPVINIRVRAFVATSVMPLTGNQTLYVIVQDQNLKPVENAKLNFEVYYEDGQKQSFQMAGTDSSGISKERFTVNVRSPEIVSIQVTATFQTLQSHTKTSFQTWW